MPESDVIRLLVFGAIYFLWFVSRVTQKRKTQGSTTEAGAPSVGGATTEASRPDALIQNIDDLLADLQARSKDLRRDIQGLGRAGGALEDAIRDTIDGPLDDLANTWGSVRRMLVDGTVVSNLREHVRNTSDWVTVLRNRMASISTLAQQRGGDLGVLLDDADAVARAFISPFGEFARTHNIDFPQQEPICVPARGHSESVGLDRLPNHPVLSIPENFNDDIFRWMAVPHELAHVVWRRTPGLADEIRNRLGLHRPTSLLGERDLVSELPARLVSAWLPELFADWVAVIAAGPASIHGFDHVFRQPGNPDGVATVWVTRQGYYDEHPPAHIRLLSACSLLRRMGFIIEADQLEAQWRSAHPIETIQVPIVNRRQVPFRANDLSAYVSAFAELLYDSQFESLAGRSFVSIPGFEMSPGLWARVHHDATKLAAGNGFHDNARLVVCGAIEARWHRPEFADEIREATKAAIIGVHAPLSDRHARRRIRVHAHGRFRRADFRDALVLQNITRRRRI